MIVLKSELENRPAPAQGANAAEFDVFRAQMTRNINTLQSQIQNLQKQISARPCWGATPLAASLLAMASVQCSRLHRWPNNLLRLVFAPAQYLIGHGYRRAQPQQRDCRTDQ